MSSAYFDGLFLGLGLIVAIGAQNAFVLRQGLRREHVFAVSLTCALSDALLIAAGVSGFATLTRAAPWIGPVLRIGGALFLIAYGARSFHAAWAGGGRLDPAEAKPAALMPTLVTCLALTWLNPHVYLDTLVFLGSISAQYGASAPTFGMGAVSGSFLFFFSLGYGARILRPVFARPRAWQMLEIAIGIVMWTIAAQLLLEKTG